MRMLLRALNILILLIVSTEIMNAQEVHCIINTIDSTGIEIEDVAISGIDYTTKSTIATAKVEAGVHEIVMHPENTYHLLFSSPGYLKKILIFELNDIRKVPSATKESLEFYVMLVPHASQDTFQPILPAGRVYYSTEANRLAIDTFAKNLFEQANFIEGRERDAREARVKAIHSNELLEAENKRQSQFNLFLSIGSVLVLTLALVLFYSYRRSQNQKKKIQTQKEEIETANINLQNKNQEIAQKNKETTESIEYASTLQNALQSPNELLRKYFPEHFILFRPKDIVSGDFYWFCQNETGFYLAVCDSTGHGVPGAIMTTLNQTLLSQATNSKQFTSPAAILNHARKGLLDNFIDATRKDGMDGIILRISDQLPMIVQYAAANNKPVLVRGGEAIQLLADRMPIGRSEIMNPFQEFSIDVKPNDWLYLFTDGFADQFGGPDKESGGKKFKQKKLVELIAKLSQLPATKQKDELEKTFIEWKGNLEQVDDICIVGIRF
jgi:serine phosphatase RsbU (regulator of sigma subunit)